MTDGYLKALELGFRRRLCAIGDGSDDIDVVTELICDEVRHAFARGELMALRHLTEKATAEATAQSALTV